jgi:hypothetical protein
MTSVMERATRVEGDGGGAAMNRRKVLCRLVEGVSAGLLLRMSAAQAADKMTPQQAQYQDTPSGIYSCAVCTLFEAPNSCKVVEGEVSRDGWCKAFALAD